MMKRSSRLWLSFKIQALHMLLGFPLALLGLMFIELFIVDMSVLPYWWMVATHLAILFCFFELAERIVYKINKMRNKLIFRELFDD